MKLRMPLTQICSWNLGDFRRRLRKQKSPSHWIHYRYSRTTIWRRCCITRANLIRPSNNAVRLWSLIPGAIRRIAIWRKSMPRGTCTREAVSELKAAMDLSPANFEALAELGYVYGVSGMKNEARAVLERIKSSRNVSAYRLAIVYAGLGENDNALKSLKEAVDSRAPGIVHLKVAPFFSQIRSQEPISKTACGYGSRTG